MAQDAKPKTPSVAEGTEAVSLPNGERMTLEDALVCAVEVLTHNGGSYGRRAAIRLTCYLRSRRTQRQAALVRAAERRVKDVEWKRFRDICS